MNLETFINEVKSLPSKGYKQLDSEFVRFMKDRLRFCPLTAVCHSKTGLFISNRNFDVAGMHLGLNINESFSIASAADTNHDLDEFCEELRKNDSQRIS